jgi:preprotein translocase subunit SecY
MSEAPTEMVKCPHCLSEIPAKANVCSHCGRTVRHVSFWGPALVVIFVVLAIFLAALDEYTAGGIIYGGLALLLVVYLIRRRMKR